MTSDRPIVLFNRLNALRRELDQVHLIAVTKYSPVEDVVFAYQADQMDFGENRVSDLKEKALIFHERGLQKVRWHFIGHLQTNKVKELLKIPNLVAVHSIDSIRLLEELLKRQSDFQGEKLDLFFQINTSHEEEKSGFDVSESNDELKLALKLLLSAEKSSPYRFKGLMTIGAIRTNNIEESAHHSFSELVKVKKEIEKEFGVLNLELSMGMTGDYKVALQHDTHYVRIGSLIFKDSE